MINVEHLRERIGTQLQPITDQGPLEVAHAAFATLHAPLQRLDGTWRQTVDTAADETRMVARIKEARDSRIERIACLLDSFHIERLFVVDVVGYGAAERVLLRDDGWAYSSPESAAGWDGL